MNLVTSCRYSTGLGVTGGSALIHEFYSREVSNPIHLTVDTGFADGDGTIKAYVSNNLSLGDQQIAAQFQEIPLDLRMVEAERIGCMYWLDFIFVIYLFYVFIKALFFFFYKLAKQRSASFHQFMDASVESCSSNFPLIGQCVILY